MSHRRKGKYGKKLRRSSTEIDGEFWLYDDAHLGKKKQKMK
jgi:hypothetical protein